TTKLIFRFAKVSQIFIPAEKAFLRNRLTKPRKGVLIGVGRRSGLGERGRAGKAGEIGGDRVGWGGVGGVGLAGVVGLDRLGRA
ncbi:MAG: hypothetical protein WC455_10445, partial [Dehalococcoidia bacterium]